MTLVRLYPAGKRIKRCCLICEKTAFSATTFFFWTVQQLGANFQATGASGLPVKPEWTWYWPFSGKEQMR